MVSQALFLMYSAQICHASSQMMIVVATAKEVYTLEEWRLRSSLNLTWYVSIGTSAHLNFRSSGICQMSQGIEDKHVQRSESLVSSLCDTSLQSVCNSSIVVVGRRCISSWTYLVTGLGYKALSHPPSLCFYWLWGTGMVLFDTSWVRNKTGDMLLLALGSAECQGQMMACCVTFGSYRHSSWPVQLSSWHMVLWSMAVADLRKLLWFNWMSHWFSCALCKLTQCRVGSIPQRSY